MRDKIGRSIPQKKKIDRSINAKKEIPAQSIQSKIYLVVRKQQEKLTWQQVNDNTYEAQARDGEA